MTLKEPKEASLVSRSDEYIPWKGKVCAKAYRSSLSQHIFTTNPLCARHHSREQIMQNMGLEASRQRQEQGPEAEDCFKWSKNVKAANGLKRSEGGRREVVEVRSEGKGHANSWSHWKHLGFYKDRKPLGALTWGYRDVTHSNRITAAWQRQQGKAVKGHALTRVREWQLMVLDQDCSMEGVSQRTYSDFKFWSAQGYTLKVPLTNFTQI